MHKKKQVLWSGGQNVRLTNTGKSEHQDHVIFSHDVTQMILKLWKMISPRILRVYYASKQAQALLENCTLYIAEILLRLLSAGVWYVCVHWEPWVKVNKHTSPLLNMWLRVAAKFTPKLADLLTVCKNARKFTAKIVHKLGSCRGL